MQWRPNEFESVGRGWGGTRPAQGADEIVCRANCPSTFLTLQSQLVVLVSAFVVVSTV